MQPESRRRRRNNAATKRFVVEREANRNTRITSGGGMIGRSPVVAVLRVLGRRAPPQGVSRASCSNNGGDQASRHTPRELRALCSTKTKLPRACGVNLRQTWDRDDDEAAKDSAERPTERAGSLLRPPGAEALQVVVPPPSWKDPGPSAPCRRVLELRRIPKLYEAEQT
ncbi:hypothetical protein HPB51_010208 [Rhipicephalus microplus]|uniref:Uncharacterized protein n=1 Tax=Rhipicephalus microplus TaxID=6941 RepID=A0A9J6F1T8_RHIMP|nr:hypothetical protein HPB51_010208 [Rhipicephalus microplus]